MESINTINQHDNFVNIELSGRPGVGSREPSRQDRSGASGRPDLSKGLLAETQDNTPGAGQSPALCPHVTFPTTSTDSNSSFDEVLLPFADNANIIVGFDKLRQLLQPQHAYFRDKQAFITEFATYKHNEEDKYNFVFPRVKGETPFATRNNPYRKYKLSRTHSGRTVSQISGLVESNNLADLRAAVLSFTVPESLSLELSKLGKKGINIFWSAYKKLVNFDVPLILDLSGEIGSLNNLHCWSTSNPLKPHYHFHQVMLNYQLVGGSRIGGIISGGKFEKWFGKGIHKKYIDPVTKKEKHGPVAFSDDQLIQIKKAWVVRLKAMCLRNKISCQYLDGINLKTLSDSEIASKIDVYVSFVLWKSGANMHRFINKINYQKRHWLEDFAYFSNKNLDCPDPPAWLEKYENRSRPFGYWCYLSEYGGIEDSDGERVSPFTGRRMIKDGITTVYGLLRDKNVVLGGMAIIRGLPVIWKLCWDDANWLIGVAKTFKGERLTWDDFPDRK